MRQPVTFGSFASRFRPFGWAVMATGLLSIPSDSSPAHQFNNPGVDQFTAHLDPATENKKKVLAAENDSLIPLLRKHFQSQKIEGQGTTFAIIDAPSWIQKEDITHADIIRQRINSRDNYGGLATAAKTTFPYSYRFRNPLKGVNYYFPDNDNEENLKQFIGITASKTIGGINDCLSEIRKSRNKFDVINISIGDDLTGTTEYVLQALLEQRDINPKLCNLFFGPNPDKLAPDEKFLIVLKYVKKELRESRIFQETMKEYQDMSDAFWKDNTLIVVAAGNSNALKPELFNTRDFEGLYGNDTLATSYLSYGKAISVGSVSTHGVPLDLKAHVIHPSSSLPGKYGLLAQGENVKIENRIVNGTSYAAPFVSSIILLMKQVNPKLTSDQIYHILSTTGVLKEQTAGNKITRRVPLIDPVRAVQQAKAAF